MNKVLIWIIIFFIPPIIIGHFLIQSSFSKIYNKGLFPAGTTTPETISEAPFLTKFSEIWLDGPIQPNGEKVCVTNKNKVYVNGIQIALPYAQDLEVGSMQIDVNFSDYSHQKLVYVPINATKCGSFVNRPNTSFSSSTVIYRYPTYIPVVLSRTHEGQIGGTASMGTDPGESTYSIYPLQSDVLTTCLKAFVFWWVLIFAIFESIEVTHKLKKYWDKK